MGHAAVLLLQVLAVTRCARSHSAIALVICSGHVVIAVDYEPLVFDKRRCVEHCYWVERASGIELEQNEVRAWSDHEISRIGRKYLVDGHSLPTVLPAV